MKKLLYDISVLGRGFCLNRSRTGIYRVVESVAAELGKMGWLSGFTAGPGLADYLMCERYLERADSFDGVPLIRPEINGFGLQGYRVLERAVRGVPGKAGSLLRRALRAMERSHDRSKVLDIEEVESYDIYHALYDPVPDEVRRLRSVSRFQTVYDIIPIKFPEYCSRGSVRQLERIVSSIDEKTNVLCISQHTKDDLCELTGMDPGRAFVTYLAASDMFRRCTDREELERVLGRYGLWGFPYILGLSTLEPRKNVATVIRSFAGIVRENAIPDLRLVLVGQKGWKCEGIFAELEADPALRKRVILTGYLPDEDLPAIYTGATAFLYLSFYEGFGLPPLEAMQCGVPVITSNASSLPEVVGDAGILVAHEDEDAVAQAVIDIHASCRLSERLSEAGMRRTRKFSWSKCAEQTVAAYETASGNA